MDRAKTRWFKQGIWIIERKIRNFLIKVNDIPNTGIIGERKEKMMENFFYRYPINFVQNSFELLTFLGRNSHDAYTNELSKQDRKDNLYIFSYHNYWYYFEQILSCPFIKKKSLKFCNNFPKAVSDVKK